MTKILVSTCPNCGANLSGGIEMVCEFCGSAYMPKNLSTLAKMDRTTKHKYITSYKEILQEHADNVPISISLAMCHIDAGNYEFALNILEKLAHNDCSDPNVFYYITLAMLEGKKPRVLHMNKIRRLESFLNSAQFLSGGDGLYYILQAAIKRDYYEYYLFNRHPGDGSKTLLEKANHYTLDAGEIHELMKLVNLDPEDRQYFDSVLAI